ncbi:MAG: molecular chaperone HtpG, partial [Candidatus Auribacterota bacterium]|nr:molecular chaperone HtpG [Candidatus Auribacterota bacterium]
MWRENSSEVKEEELFEFYKFITNDYDGPLGHLHLSIEGTGASFKALLFIPKSAPVDLLRMQDLKSLHLYSNKILIQDDCKGLLPEYLRFVKGVVDTSDLPLNVSREVVQSSPAMPRIKNILITKILALLKGWANSSPEKYDSFYKKFGVLFKTGINTDFSNRDKIIELLRFESSAKPQGEMISLKEYVANMKKDQKEIYYLSGENRDALERNPNLEYFKKNEIDVLLLTEPVDIFIMPSIFEYNKIPIKAIDKEDVDLMAKDKIETPDDNLSQSLVSIFKDTLTGKVDDVVVSKRLVDSAVTLVVGKNAMDPQV